MMKLRHLSLALLLLLVMWKVVRTDWVVSGPYYFHDPAKVSEPSYTTQRINGPITPMWQPPEPQDMELGAEKWDALFPGGGAWGLTGPAKLGPNWRLIGIKITVAYLALFPFVMLAHRFMRKGQATTAPALRRGRRWGEALVMAATAVTVMVAIGAFVLFVRQNLIIANGAKGMGAGLGWMFFRDACVYSWSAAVVMCLVLLFMKHGRK